MRWYRLALGVAVGAALMASCAGEGSSSGTTPATTLSDAAEPTTAEPLTTPATQAVTLAPATTATGPTTGTGPTTTPTTSTTTTSTTTTSTTTTSTTTTSTSTTTPPPPAPAEMPTVPGQSTSPTASTAGSPTPVRVPGAIVAEGDVPRSYPFDAGVNTSFGDEHHDYPAADVFARCGTPVFSPVDGVIGFANPTNLYDPATDDPANRGGISVAMIGDDGVRYYMAHFRSIGPDIAEGRRIARGAPVGEVGDTGRASACHLHFAISPACSSLEWWVRRGVIWPQTYLESWRSGGNLSPVDAVNTFMLEHPDACTDPAAMPWPSD